MPFWVNKKKISTYSISTNNGGLIDYLFGMWILVENIPRRKMDSGCLNAASSGAHGTPEPPAGEVPSLLLWSGK